MLLTGSGVPMAVPHTRPTLVTSHSTDPKLATGNPCGSIGSRSRAASRRCWSTGGPRDHRLGFVAHVPHYLAQSTFPQATAAVLRRMNRAAGLRIPLGALEDEAEQPAGHDRRGGAGGLGVRCGAGGRSRSSTTNCRSRAARCRPPTRSARRWSSSSPSRTIPATHFPEEDRRGRPAPPVNDALDLLDLEQIDTDLFRGHSRTRCCNGLRRPGAGPGARGGRHRTVAPSGVAHSLNAYFLRPGPDRPPILYLVEITRDGRSFSQRGWWPGRTAVIFSWSARSTSPEDGLRSRRPVPDRRAEPDECPPAARRCWGKASARRAAFWELEWGALDVRYVDSGRRRSRRAIRAHPARSAGLDQDGGRCRTTRGCTRPRWPTPATSRCCRPARCRTACSSGSTCRPPRSTTRCGSTGRSAPTSGCSTTRCRRRRPAASGSPPGRLFQHGVLVATWPRRA